MAESALPSYHQQLLRDKFIRGSGLNDGEWHDVRFLAKENFAMLTIDGDEASAVRTNSPVQITTGSTYHFGGKFTNLQRPKLRMPKYHKNRSSDLLTLPAELVADTDLQRPLYSFLLRDQH
ncbi:Contactin-associated protein-like 2 [Anabarilius grahami]|uniref:Contactin-associated protein-like 2 n=1 Tax=Anabarilius grahami TaxID=495550 RepID=A0A3N0XV69_ANAGA|nr:Contactin-associated protein-like 2 [Anabarilius grahami]